MTHPAAPNAAEQQALATTFRGSGLVSSAGGPHLGLSSVLGQAVSGLGPFPRLPLSCLGRGRAR